MTRFDCAWVAMPVMRRAFSLAIYHAHQRHVFGNPLIQQPLMRHVLSRMALQLEGQTALLFRLARAWDRRADAKEALWARLFTPAAKFVICKRGMPFVAEAMEVLAALVIARRAAAAALPGDAGKQYLGRFRQYYVPGCVARSQ
ncbi:acyl-CoA dehydrogenase family protein [Escherichia coli]